MVIKLKFRDTYVNLVARVLLFAKSLIHRLYGESMFLVSRPFFNSVYAIVSVTVRYVASLIALLFRVLFLHRKML
jgi:hypothetical protein